MNTILNEQSNFPADEPLRTNAVQSTKPAKISGILSLIVAVLATISLFLPLVSTFLFWNFLLISASLVVFGFLEKNAGKTWIGNITWLISLVFLLLLFIMGFGSFKNPQSLYFYGAFSIIVPLLMTITALIARQSAVWKAFTPLLIPVIFIVSAIILLNSRTAYDSLLLLPISWGFVGILNYLETK